MNNIIKGIVGLAMAAALTVGVSVPANAATISASSAGVSAVRGSDGGKHYAGGSMDINTKGKPWTGTITAELRRADGKGGVVKTESIKVSQKTYQIGWLFNKKLSPGNTFVIKITAPAAKGHAKSSLTSKSFKVK